MQIMKFKKETDFTNISHCILNNLDPESLQVQKLQAILESQAHYWESLQ